MGEHSYIKCLSCGTLNYNLDYCQNCGTIINIVLKRRIEEEEKRQEKLQNLRPEKETGFDRIFKSALEHPNSIIRFWASTVQWVWTFLAMVIGALIAFVVAVAAG